MHACFVVAWARVRLLALSFTRTDCNCLPSPQMPHEVVRFVSSSQDAGMPFNFLTRTNFNSEASLNLIFLQMNASEIANNTMFKLRGEERESVRPLAEYAAQGSVLAKQMLAILPNSSRLLS